MSFRVYGAARVQRARSFAQGQQLRIHIGHHQLDDGRVVNRVSDFDACGAASAIDFQRGVDGDDPSAGPTPEPAGQTTAQPPDSLIDRLRAALAGNRPHGANDPEHVAAEAVPAPRAGCDALEKQFAFGFWSPRTRVARTIVDHDFLFQLCAASDERMTGLGEGYLSVCQYSSDLASYSDGNESKSLAGYRGATWARWLAIDIDGDGSPEGLGRTLHEARRIVTALVALGIARTHVLAFFSGRRGVHLLFPSTAFAAAPMERFEKVAGIACGLIAGLVGVTIDKSLYDPLKLLRAHNTRHDKTSLYKVLIGLDELDLMTSEAVLELARQPRPFPVPDWRVPPVELLVELWQWACRIDGAPNEPENTAGHAAAPKTGEPHLFAATLELIVHGAPEGARGTRFFQAGMNLLDFDCPEGLLVALLEPAARLSNYPPGEFMSQIQGAIKAHALSRNTTSV